MIQKKYQAVIFILKDKFPDIYDLAFRFRKVIKYVIAGGLATLSTFLSLYFFTAIVKFWYVASSIIAVVIGTAVSFYLQKFWTFRDETLDKIKKQVFLYIGVLVLNAGFNAVGIYVLVQYFSFHYLVAQLLLSAAMAFLNFFIFGRIIFKKVIMTV